MAPEKQLESTTEPEKDLTKIDVIFRKTLIRMTVEQKKEWDRWDRAKKSSWLKGMSKQFQPISAANEDND